MIQFVSSKALLLFVSFLVAFLASSGLGESTTYYVNNTHPNANDQNQGTIVDLPLKTISAGLFKAFPGDTVQLYSGTYRESIVLARGGESPERPIILRSAPANIVTIKGSDTVNNWVFHSGSIWKKPGWKVNSQQVFSDGEPLQQIGGNCPFNALNWGDQSILPAIGTGLSDLKPKTFFYDQINETLYVWLLDGSNPNNHLLEASVRNFIIPSTDFSYIELRNLKFSHSNMTSIPYMLGIVNVSGESWVVSDCSFTYGDFAGLSIAGANHRIVNNVSNYNGNLGISINGTAIVDNPNSTPLSQNIFLENNETSYNNYRGFFSLFQAGGIKAANSCNVVRIYRHKAISNNGTGIWFDSFCSNIVVDRSILNKNTRGIEYEISTKAILSNNLIVGNTEHGIYISASDEVSVANNTLIENGNGIVVHGMPRAERLSLKNNKIKNNILCDSAQADLILYYNIQNATGNISDYNLFFSKNREKTNISWTTDSAYRINYNYLNQFSIDTGQDTHSVWGDPLLKNRATGDYTLGAGSPAIDSGSPTNEAIGDKDFQGDARISDGSGTGAIIDIGAFEYSKSNSLSAPKNLKLIN